MYFIKLIKAGSAVYWQCRRQNPQLIWGVASKNIKQHHRCVLWPLRGTENTRLVGPRFKALWHLLLFLLMKFQSKSSKEKGMGGKEATYACMYGEQSTLSSSFSHWTRWYVPSQHRRPQHFFERAGGSIYMTVATKYAASSCKKLLPEKSMWGHEWRVPRTCVVCVWRGGVWNGRKFWFCSEDYSSFGKKMKCPNFIYSHHFDNEILKKNL